jgi:hypothetical protein
MRTKRLGMDGDRGLANGTEWGWIYNVVPIVQVFVKKYSMERAKG